MIIIIITLCVWLHIVKRKDFGDLSIVWWQCTMCVQWPISFVCVRMYICIICEWCLDGRCRPLILRGTTEWSDNGDGNSSAHSPYYTLSHVLLWRVFIFIYTHTARTIMKLYTRSACMIYVCCPPRLTITQRAPLYTIHSTHTFIYKLSSSLLLYLYNNDNIRLW